METIRASKTAQIWAHPEWRRCQDRPCSSALPPEWSPPTTSSPRSLLRIPDAWESRNVSSKRSARSLGGGHFSSTRHCFRSPSLLARDLGLFSPSALPAISRYCHTKGLLQRQVLVHGSIIWVSAILEPFSITRLIYAAFGV